MHHALHATHRDADAQDMRNMGGLRRHLPWTFALMLIATLAIAGVPGFSGFFSKDEILAAAFGRAAQGGGQPIWYLFWGMAAVAAFLTAFYMMRLIAMTFLGENRTGEREREHLHEAPWIMTGPLVILGLLSAVGGVINLPAFAGGHHALETWLAPALQRAHALMPVAMPHGPTEWALVGAAVALSVTGLLLGWRSTLARPIPVAAEAPPERGFAKVLFRKYYIDEIYDALLVRPLVALSRVVLWKGVDQGLVDGAAVNGAAGVTRSLGWLGSRLQTGQVGFYVVVFLLGAVWLLRAAVR